jgi:hypothetical protein
MNPDEAATRRRLRAWTDLAPFYLDYEEALQCNFALNDLQWVGAPEAPNSDGLWELEVVLSGQLEQNSFLTVMTVLYPTADTLVSAEELTRSDGLLTSPQPPQNPV